MEGGRSPQMAHKHVGRGLLGRKRGWHFSWSLSPHSALRKVRAQSSPLLGKVSVAYPPSVREFRQATLKMAAPNGGKIQTLNARSISSTLSRPAGERSFFSVSLQLLNLKLLTTLQVFRSMVTHPLEHLAHHK